MRVGTLGLGLCLAVVAAGCDSCRSGSTKTDAPSASASASASTRPVASYSELLSAEHKRDSAGITSEWLSHRQVGARRVAARALARIADKRSLELLERMLGDEDLEVVTWASYGLGYGCKGREIATVRALVQRAATLAAQPEPTQGSPPLSDPVHAVADALGRCGSREAEATLRGWLTGPKPRAEAAALALGRLASRQKRLEDASIVALLNAASDPDAPLGGGLFAFSRLGPLPEPVQNRLRDVARGALGKAGSERAFAVRALGRAGDAAIVDLEKFALDFSHTPSERADAARELGKNGKLGSEALARILDVLATDARLTKSELTSPNWGVLITALESMTQPPETAQDVLSRLESLAVPGTKGSHRMRVERLRCAAAASRAGENHRYKKLVECQSGDDAPVRSHALLKVLDRGKLQGARYRAWESLSKSRHPGVRQAALRLLARHPETANTHKVLASALEAAQDGTVATAAEILSTHPALAASTRGKQDESKRDVAPHADVIDALQRAFTKRRAPDATEIRQSLIAAAGGLQVMRLKAEVEKECKSSAPTLRAAAEKALRSLGDRNKRCDKATPSAAPAELQRLRSGSVRMTLETDVGKLELALDANVAPVTVTRVASLVESGFYDGIVFHRVVPGFVVQFGDPGADGFGGAGREMLRCETSPIGFSPLSVGMALSGRDTGSSQLFVTLGPFPHLDGDYAWIGRAEGQWQRLAQGDRIRKARVTR